MNINHAFFLKMVWILVVILLSVFYLFITTVSIFSLSLTHDEHQYMAAGIYYLRHHDFRVNRGNPPFVKLIYALPVDLIYQPEVPLANEELIIKKNDIWDYFLNFLFVANKHGLEMVNIARMINILLSLCIGLTILLISNIFWGKFISILAFILYLFNPNTLANATVATLDIGLSLFFFLSWISFWFYLKKSSLKTLVLVGVLTGLTISSKFSGLLLLPIYFVALLMLKKKKLVYRIGLITTVSLLTVWAIYGFETRSINHFPLPLYSFVKGITFQYHVNQQSWPGFLWGASSMFGWRYYYFLAFILKNPISYLILLSISLFLSFKKRLFTSKTLWFWLLPVITYVSFFSLVSKINIGLRYLLPIYPFLTIFLAAVLVKIKWSKIRIISLAILVIWYITSSISVSPNFLTYFNGLVGGPGKGYKYLVDSDLDWGQAFIQLKRYMEQNKIESLYLLKFGFVDPKVYGLSYQNFPTENCEVMKGLIAMSATPLQNTYYLKNRTCIEYVKKNGKMKDLVANSILIFHL